MVDVSGAIVEGNSENTFTWEEDFDDTKYSIEEKTDVIVTNQFDNADINYWVEDSVTYLSRSDWEGTYPVAPTQIEATDEMITELNGGTYVKPEDSLSISDFTQGDNQGITLASMMGVAYDDSLWDTFINQLTIDEMASLVADRFGTAEITSIGKPAVVVGDGPDGIGGQVSSFTADKYGVDVPTNCYTSEIVLASTFNKDLIARRGELMGEESLFLGIMENWGPGVNLHRTPFGGRNFEYFSEDANMSYLCSVPYITAFQENGVNAGPKHVTGNEQENNREGIACFFNEQAFREGSLRGVEGAVKVADAKSAMQGFNRLGLTGNSSSYALNTQVMRNEWGFIGHIETDAVVGAVEGYKSHYTTNLAAGTDSFCLDFPGQSTIVITEAINSKDDGNLLSHLRRASKNILYVTANSNIMNGYDTNTVVEYITPWWQTALKTIIVVFGIIDVLAIVMVVKKRKKNTIVKVESEA